MLETDPAVTILMPAIEAETSASNLVTTAFDDEQPVEVFGHYRIVGSLGRGGMGTVYRALDESLQRYVALKVILAPSGSDDDTRHVQRLLQEAIAQARVNHPNIVHIYFVGVQGSAPFFAMELVQGPTLAQRLKEGALTFGEVIGFAEQIVSALAHAAEFDILHGDIKPSNILLSNSQIVKLTDFGLARRLSEIVEPTGVISGTPDYLAPETLAGVPLDVRSDMYSLGVTLFEMTFGRLPYQYSGRSIAERLRVHQEEPVDFPVPWPKQIPEPWRDVLAKLLSKTPEQRYPTYDELRLELGRLKPITLLAAARAPRALAWIVDLGLAQAAQQLAAAPMTFVAVNNSLPLMQLAAPILSSVILLLASLLQSTWQKSPGKKLFQLRIVDRHGLIPRKPVLFARMAMQLLPIWATVLYQMCSAIGAESLGKILASAFVLVTLLDGCCVLFTRRKRSLHDLLFRTEVVLDA